MTFVSNNSLRVNHVMQLSREELTDMAFRKILPIFSMAEAEKLLSRVVDAMVYDEQNREQEASFALMYYAKRNDAEGIREYLKWHEAKRKTGFQ